MRDLFDRLRNEGEAVLQEMLEANTAEGVDLEFKEKSDLERPGFNKPDKQALGRTLSAFANSAGGLLIFGAAARKNADGVDCLSELKPIPDIARLGTEASALLAQYLMPRHEGVRHIAVPSGRGDGSGYLAIHVERSDRRPHQSKAPDDSRYYKRAGDSTFAMEHYDIEDAFNRHATPVLEAVVEMRSARTSPDGGWTIPIALGVRNVGQALARFPYISLGRTNAYVIESVGHDLAPRWRLTKDHPGYQLTGTVDHVVHANTIQIGGGLYVPLKMLSGAWTLFGLPYEDVVITVRFQFGAEGFQAVEEREFDGDAIHAALVRGGAVSARQ